MEKRIALEARGKNPPQVKDLNLDNCRSTSIVGLTDEYTKLESLSLINVGLTSLKGFPKLANLKRLELSDNRICNGLNLLSGSRKLSHLNLSGNKIGNIETLEPLKEFSKLKNLDLFNNDVTSIEEYRTKVFDLIPSLKYLDGFDQDDREADESDGDDEELNGNDEAGEEESVSGDFDEEDDDDDEDISLSAVYNEHLDEESSDDFEVSGEEAEDEEDGLDDEEAEQEEENQAQADPEESTRGKKRKHEEESEPNN